MKLNCISPSDGLTASCSRKLLAHTYAHTCAHTHSCSDCEWGFRFKLVGVLGGIKSAGSVWHQITAVLRVLRGNIILCVVLTLNLILMRHSDCITNKYVCYFTILITLNYGFRLQVAHTFTDVTCLSGISHRHSIGLSCGECTPQTRGCAPQTIPEPFLLCGMAHYPVERGHSHQGILFSWKGVHGLQQCMWYVSK